METPLSYVLGQVLPLAVGVALSPLPVIAIVLLAMSPRGRTSGPAFVVGRMLALAIVSGVVIAADVLYAIAEGARLPAIVKLVLGVAIFGLGVTKWRPKPKGVEPELPAWMSALESMSAGRGLGLGVLVTVANPKELALILAVGLTVGGASLAVLDEVLLAVAFVFVASLTILAPVVAVLVAPKRVAPLLERLRAWLTQNHSVVMGILLVVIGAVVAGDAISDLGR